MHDGELDIDAGMVERPVGSAGTVNAIYRLGDDLCVCLPWMRRWADALVREQLWLPRIAPHLSLRVPEPVCAGRPAAEYPFAWAVYRWLAGQPYADDLVADECEAAADLAQFVLELRGLDPAGAPRAGRRPLRELDADTREAIESAASVIDGAAALAAWAAALDTRAWDGTPTWIHADLLRPNLLVHRGRIGAVIDFGSVGAGDPASDVIAAWSVFGRAGRATYRAALDVDDATWSRARGIALHQAAMIIPYYATTNPGFVTLAKRTVEEILADVGARRSGP